MKICKNCGHTTEIQSAKFCNMCGSILEDVTQNEEVQPAQNIEEIQNAQTEAEIYTSQDDAPKKENINKQQTAPQSPAYSGMVTPKKEKIYNTKAIKSIFLSPLFGSSTFAYTISGLLFLCLFVYSNICFDCVNVFFNMTPVIYIDIVFVSFGILLSFISGITGRNIIKLKSEYLILGVELNLISCVIKIITVFIIQSFIQNISFFILNPTVLDTCKYVCKFFMILFILDAFFVLYSYMTLKKTGSLFDIKNIVKFSSIIVAVIFFIETVLSTGFGIYGISGMAKIGAIDISSIINASVMLFISCLCTLFYSISEMLKGINLFKI